MRSPPAGSGGQDQSSTQSLPTGVAGLVLAAGEGRRMGRPKALLRDGDGRSWVRRSVEVLVEGGIDGAAIHVVVGAAADAVAREVPAGCVLVEAEDWREGMGASLRAGVAAVRRCPSVASVVVMLVDTPGVGADVVRRLVAQAQAGGTEVLARASYAGRLGHPVLIGRAHWAAVQEQARGDEGARAYLREHVVTAVECADVGSDVDIDTAADLGRLR